MCIWPDITEVQDCEMHYMNAWLKRCVFNLDLNRECLNPERYQEDYSRAWEPDMKKFYLLLWTLLLYVPRVQSFATLG